MNKTPVTFTCTGCNTVWKVPPESCCPNCGPQGPHSDPDPYVYEVHEVVPHLWITGQMKDVTRFDSLCEESMPDCLVDLAGDHHYIWRPSSSMLRDHGVAHYRIDGIFDSGCPFPSALLAQFCGLMNHVHFVEGKRTIVHCAAGLRRAPHFVYAYLRSLHYDPVEAWDAVEKARSRAYMHPPYIESIETWLAKS